jgi:hypothetical protein
MQVVTLTHKTVLQFFGVGWEVKETHALSVRMCSL